MRVNRYKIIGMMSGTSLDGIDVVYLTFFKAENNDWSFEVTHSKLFSFEDDLLQKLKNAYTFSATKLSELNSELGRFYGKIINDFISNFKIDRKNIDFITNHGQTIFHQPKKGYTLQIGNSPEIAITTNLPSIVDFRTKDVALGGNGAPLIPVADFLLFKNYAETFLNLGGFSNFSFQKDKQVFSFDICPVNIVINLLMKQIGKEFDEGGKFGKTGIVNKELLEKLNILPYYKEDYPKSLGWEWVENNVIPLLSMEKKLEHKIRTLYEHIAFQIGYNLDKVNATSVLITGGGAKNDFLIERIKEHTNCKIIIPDEVIIDFKEAIGFAFLGLLRWRNEINVWASVTGAKRDSCSGNIIYP